MQNFVFTVQFMNIFVLHSNSESYVTVLWVWEQGITCFCGNGNKNYQLETGFFVQHTAESAVKTVQFKCE